MKPSRSRDASLNESAAGDENGYYEGDEGEHLLFEPVIPLPDKVSEDDDYDDYGADWGLRVRRVQRSLWIGVCAPRMDGRNRKELMNSGYVVSGLCGWCDWSERLPGLPTSVVTPCSDLRKHSLPISSDCP